MAKEFLTSLKLNLKRNTIRLPIFGLGCVGGVIGLSRASDIARSNKGKNILFISWFWFIGSILISQLPVILESNYSDAQHMTLYFYLIILFGVISGAKFSVFYFKENKNQENIYKFFILNSFLLLILGFNEFYNFIYLICTLLFMVSFISISYVIPLYVNIQKYSLNKDRSKVIACNNIWNAIFMIISGVYIVLVYLFELSIHDALKYLSVLNIILMFYTYKFLGR